MLMMLALRCAESVQSLGRTATAAVPTESLQRNPADADDARTEVRYILVQIQLLRKNGYGLPCVE